MTKGDGEQAAGSTSGGAAHCQASASPAASAPPDTGDAPGDRENQQKNALRRLASFFRGLRKNLKKEATNPRFYLEVATLVIVSIYAYQTWRANNIAINNLAASERPWISVSAVPLSPLTFDKSGGHLTVRFRLANHGKSAATVVEIWGFLICPANEFDALRSQQEWCAGRRRVLAGPLREHHGVRLGYPLFPGDSMTEALALQLNESDIRDAEKGFEKLFPTAHFKITPTHILPQVVGCAIYNFGDTAYDTDFRYELLRRSSTSPDAGSAIKPQGQIPIPDLLFTATEIGNEAH